MALPGLERVADADGVKTIGLLGGMSWESSAEYYRILNQEARRRLGGAHSARLLLESLDFGEIAALQHQGEWDALTDIMMGAARRLEAGGAGCVLICTNTMHAMADAVAAAISIPLLHIADATGDALRAAGYARVGLLGTAFTMEQPFYRARLAERFGLDVIVPDPADRATVHRVIYDELVVGRIEPESRAAYREILHRMASAGAEAVILGCTEIALLVDAGDSPVPLFDTVRLHALAALGWSLA